MRWPWVSRARAMREIAQAAAAYRWERDAALVEGERLKMEYEEKLGSLLRVSSAGGHFLRRTQIVIDIDELFSHVRPSHKDYERLAQRIIRGLEGYHRDYRGDMRQVMPDGISGAELPSRIAL